MKFLAISGKDGNLSLGSVYNRNRFKQYLKDNIGMRLSIEPLLPESNDQRRYFEGAIVPFVTFFQESLDHRDSNHRKTVREWLKVQFCPKQVVIGGVVHTIGDTTKGKLQQQKLIESILDWLGEQGYPIEYLNPDNFKYWRDVIYGAGGADNYIDYLVEQGRIKK